MDHFEESTLWTIVLVMNLVGCVAVGAAARSKGLSFWVFFLGGLVVSFLFSLVAVLLAPDMKRRRSEAQAARDADAVRMHQALMAARQRKYEEEMDAQG